MKNNNSRHEYNKSPWDTASILSKAFFSFANPMMIKGFKDPLNQIDLDELPNNETADVVIEKLRINWRKECASSRNSKKKPSLRNAIYSTFRRDILLSGWWALMESVCRICQPLLLGYLLTWLTTTNSSTTGDANMYDNNNNNNSMQEGLLWGLALSSVGFIQIVVHHRLYYLTMFCGAKIRIACSGLINRKLLKLHSSSLLNASSGKLINLISNDVMRFDMFLPRLHFGWTAPLEIPIIAFLLYIRVGFVATISGIAFLFLTVPLQMYFSRKLGQRRKITAGWTDKRMKTTAEIFSGILSIKAFVWEEPFSKLIDIYRRKERTSIFHAMTMKSLNTAISFFAPNVTILIIICTYWSLGNKLTIALVFSTLALIHVLRLTIGKNLCFFLEQVGEAITSVQRIEHFLLMDEYIDINDHNKKGKMEKDQKETLVEETTLTLTNASFKWNKTDDKNALEDISFKLCENDLCVIDGATGSGKSALLQAILGELTINKSSAMSHIHNIAYSSQKAWIFSGTIKSNILWGASSDGIIIENVESSDENNSINNNSSPFDEVWYKKVIHACCLEKDLEQLPDKDATEIGEKGVNLSGGQRARIGLARAVYAKKKLILLDDVLAACDSKVARRIFRNCILKLLKDQCVILVTHSKEYQEFATKCLTLNEGKLINFKKNDNILNAKNGKEKDEIVQLNSILVNDVTNNGKKIAHVLVPEEERVKGKIETGTFYKYLHAAGDGLVLSVGFLLITTQILSFGAEFTLKTWTESKNPNNDRDYLNIFIIFTAFVVVLSFLRAVLFFHAALQASTSIHNRAFTSVVLSPLTFFVQNPLGRILNKFSSDLGQADETLPTTLYRCLESLILCFGSLVICCIAVPWILIIVLPLFYFLIRLRTYFVCTGRELKRLESLSKSPLFVAFADSLHGLVSIRSFNKVNEVTLKFENNLNENLKAWYSWLLANRWVGTRLDITSWVILLLVTFGGVLMSSANAIDPGMLGFAITYAIQLSGVFQYMIRLSAQVETQMTGVERVMHYADNLIVEETEEQVSKAVLDDDKTWPLKGGIHFKNVSVRYRKDLPAVLTQINFNVKGSQKVGIVGRTGSGKTSLINALLRLNEVFEGNIYIDDVDSSKISLKLLRRNIGFVPQEPNLFAGTLRFNIDPFNKATDEEIWNTLEKCNLKKAVDSLDMPIQESGGNLSVGQRQCLSLARALLHNAKIYIMDEATANIDNETDLLIQQMVKTNFADKTILTIAHRLDTIMDSDVILVLDQGKVIEHGSPTELQSREGSTFKSMLRQHDE